MSTLRITRLKDLRKLGRKFAAGEIPAVMVVGPPGQGKTQTLLAAIGKRPHLPRRGRLSALSLYEDLYLHRDQLVVLDDTAEMLKDRNVQELLRDLSESTKSKQISWRTQSKILVDKGIPNSFVTTSHLCVVANVIGTGGVWPALKSRCMEVEVEFTWEELIEDVRRQMWFEDEEILTYAEMNARCRPDLRLLEKALNQKRIKLGDWRQVFGSAAVHLPPAVDPTRIADAIVSSPGISLRGLHRQLGNNVKKELLNDALEQAINDGRIRKEKRLTGGRPAATFWPASSQQPQPPERTKPAPPPTVAVATGVEPAVSSPDTYPDTAVEAL
jgi:hypothetical protein